MTTLITLLVIATLWTIYIEYKNITQSRYPEYPLAHMMMNFLLFWIAIPVSLDNGYLREDLEELISKFRKGRFTTS